MILDYALDYKPLEFQFFIKYRLSFNNLLQELAGASSELNTNDYNSLSMSRSQRFDSWKGKRRVLVCHFHYVFSTITKAFSTVGTPDYIAPEVFMVFYSNIKKIFTNQKRKKDILKCVTGGLLE